MSILVVGSLNVDQISYCDRLPAPGETLIGSNYETGLGGKGANQAVQAALLSEPGKAWLDFLEHIFLGKSIELRSDSSGQGKGRAFYDLYIFEN